MTSQRLSRRSSRHHAGHTDGLERLEPRQLLASDLVARLNLAQITQADLVPGSRINVTLIVENAGPDRATGTVNIGFFMSSDSTLDANDPLIQAFPGEALDLGPGVEGDFFAPMEVPRNIAAGGYFIFARILPATGVNDTLLSNNTVSSPTAYTITNRFGVVGNRQREVLKLRDADGTEVNFDTGANGVGTGTVSVVDGRYVVSFAGTGSSTNVLLTSAGGDGFVDLGNITAPGALGSFTASAGRLRGTFSVQGTLGSATFASVGSSTIQINAAAATATSLTLGAVTDTSITAAGPIALSVSTWVDTNASTSPDTITAPSITSLSGTGAFAANLRVTGGGVQPVLGAVTITGPVRSGTWIVNGNTARIAVGATLATFSASVSGRVAALDVTGVLRGVFAARNFGPITVGLDIAGARLLAGANLGADGRLGGTGANADLFRNGNFATFNVGRRVNNAVIGAGLDPVDGVFRNGDDRVLTGRINAFTTTGTVSANTRFYGSRFAGPFRFAGVTVNPAVDTRFVGRDTIAPSVTLSGRITVGPSSFVQIRIEDNRAVLLSSIATGAIQLLGAGGVIVPLTFASTSPSGPGNGPLFTADFAVPGSPTGTFTVQLLAGTIRDSSNNAAAAIDLGTVTFPS